MNKNRHGLLILIPACVIALLALLLFATDVWISLTDYRYGDRLFGGDFAGSMNWERFLSDAKMIDSVGNSLAQTLMTVFISVPGALLFAFLFGLIKNRPVKAAFAGAALILAILPEQMYLEGARSVLALADEALMEMGERPFLNNAYYPVFILTKTIPLTSLCVFAALSLQLSSKLPSPLGVLLVGLLPLLSCCLPDIRMNIQATNPLNYETSRSLSYMAYNAGLLNMNIAYSETASAFGKAAGLLPGFGFALLIGLIARRSLKYPRMKAEGHSWAKEGLGALIGAVVISLAVMISILVEKETSYNDPVINNALINTILVAVSTTMVVFGILTAILSLSRRMDRRFMCALSFAVIALSLVHLSNMDIAKYLMTRNMNLFNMLVSVVMSALINPVFIAVMLVLIATQPITGRQMILTALGGALIAAAIGIGDFFPAHIYIIERSKMPLSQMLRQTQMNAIAFSADAEASREITQTVLYKNGSMALLAGSAVFFGIIAAVITMFGIGGTKVQKEKAQKVVLHK